MIVRFAQGPGELLKDSVSTHRGMAIKVLGVEGEKLEGHGGATQDFVLATGPVFPNPDAKGFLGSMKQLEAGTKAPEGVKAAVSGAARVLDGAVKSVTGESSPLLDFFGHKPHHPLAEPYYSQAALRYGDHVAKLAAFPASPSLQVMADEELHPGDDRTPSAMPSRPISGSMKRCSRSGCNSAPISTPCPSRMPRSDGMRR